MSDKKAYIIFADGEFDQVCETPEAARKAKKWLKDRDMTATSKTCPWEDQDAVIDASYGIA